MIKETLSNAIFCATRKISDQNRKRFFYYYCKVLNELCDRAYVEMTGDYNIPPDILNWWNRFDRIYKPIGLVSFKEVAEIRSLYYEGKRIFKRHKKN